MTSLIVAYFVLSLIASLVFYGSCVIAARADRCRKHPFDESNESPSEVPEDVDP